MNTIAVFRSRSQALRLFQALQAHKIACATVNTPAKYKVGCGISVIFPSSFIDLSKKLISSLGIDSFVGFFPR